MPRAKAPIIRAPCRGEAVPIAAVCASMVNPQGTMKVKAPTTVGVMLPAF